MNKLATYLLKEGISYAEMARRVGTKHARTVERHAKGKRIPDGKMMAAYLRETKGTVQPSDFFALTEPALRAAE
ncbi:MAG TPA: hypothetical protein VHL34_25005 [Rhizomicrobium sp.]|jgi:hypothetical protein|nr:hypothetical protein [Rhizomicrobium sp.]